MEPVVAHLANIPDLAELFAAYPELTVVDVRGHLKFAHAAIEEKRTSGAFQFAKITANC